MQVRLELRSRCQMDARRPESDLAQPVGKHVWPDEVVERQDEALVILARRRCHEQFPVRELVADGTVLLLVSEGRELLERPATLLDGWHAHSLLGSGTRWQGITPQMIGRRPCGYVIPTARADSPPLRIVLAEVFARARGPAM
jgi:hypothetical protein